jgi:hypothetical protein
MPATTNAILDRDGRVIFVCADCHEPITLDDLFDLGLRAPDDGESRDDYFATELLDSLSHVDCGRGKRTG